MITELRGWDDINKKSLAYNEIDEVSLLPSDSDSYNFAITVTALEQSLGCPTLRFILMGYQCMDETEHVPPQFVVRVWPYNSTQITFGFERFNVTSDSIVSEKTFALASEKTYTLEQSIELPEGVKLTEGMLDDIPVYTPEGSKINNKTMELVGCDYNSTTDNTSMTFMFTADVYYPLIQNKSERNVQVQLIFNTTFPGFVGDHCQGVYGPGTLAAIGAGISFSILSIGASIGVGCKKDAIREHFFGYATSQDTNDESDDFQEAISEEKEEESTFIAVPNDEELQARPSPSINEETPIKSSEEGAWAWWKPFSYFR